LHLQTPKKTPAKGPGQSFATWGKMAKPESRSSGCQSYAGTPWADHSLREKILGGDGVACQTRTRAAIGLCQCRLTATIANNKLVFDSRRDSG